MSELTSAIANGSRRFLAGRRNLRFAIASLIVLGAVAVVLIGPYIFGAYIQNVLVRAFLFAIAALTVGVLWGHTGVLTFSQGAFFGIGAYTAALTFTHLGFSAGYTVFVIMAAMIAAATIAAFIGWLAFWHGATPLYVAVVTLVLPIVVVQLIYSGGNFTGSSSGLVGFDAPTLSMAGWFRVSGLLLVVLTAAVWVFLRSDFGTLLHAIRDNEQRCRYLGINTSRVKILLFMTMAATASLAGFVYACVGTIVAPEHAGFIFGTELVIYTALGGRATVLGPVLGTIGLEWISAYISGAFPFIWKLFIGVIFVVVIVALPQGLLPAVGQVLASAGSAAFAGRKLSNEPVQLAPLQAPSPADESRNRERPALELRGVGKSYGSLRVLHDVNLTVMPGELVGVVGPNGAGKTTLMRCISDGLERSTGRIAVNGVSIGHHSPAYIVGFGLGRSFQNTSVYESLTVAECLRLARYRLWRPSMVGKSMKIPLPEAALQVLESTELARSLDVRVHNLSHGMKRALELAMVLSLEPSILLLDEPTAGLTKADRELVGRILVDLHARLGLAIVLIEHDFDFVKRVCSRLIVLHRGELILDGEVDAVVNAEIVREIYSGQAQ